MADLTIGDKEYMSDSKEQPVVAQTSPYGAELEPGDYWWCACGRSGKQPLCDGSHAGTAFTPLKFTVSSNDKAWLCGCKRTANPPFCDGSHKALSL